MPGRIVVTRRPRPHASLFLYLASTCALLTACAEDDRDGSNSAVQPASAPLTHAADLQFALQPGSEADIALKFVTSALPGDQSISQIVITPATTLADPQIIDTSDSELLDKTGSLVEVMDFNFDGYNDFRYPLYRTAGPNTPYKYWIYSLSAKRFVRMPELDELPSLSLDTTHRHIESQWRDGQTYGKNVFRFENEGLVQTRKEVRQYTGDGQCQITIEIMATGHREVKNCSE